MPSIWLTALLQKEGAPGGEQCYVPRAIDPSDQDTLAAENPHAASMYGTATSFPRRQCAGDTLPRSRRSTGYTYLNSRAVCSISPPLNAHEIASPAETFACSRRIEPHAAGPTSWMVAGPFGQGLDDDIREFNTAASRTTRDCGAGGRRPWTARPLSGTAWRSSDRLRGMVNLPHRRVFRKPGAALASELANPVPGRHPHGIRHFTFDHELNGVIDAQGEDDDDRWRLVVTGNTVTSVRAD